MKKVFVFGNPDLSGDALAVKMVPELEKSFPEIEFKVVDPNELDLLEEKEIIVLDVVEGLRDVRWIEIEELAKTGEQMTTHDFDASTYLLLMKKLNPNADIRILGVPRGERSEFYAGVPMDGKIENIVEDVKNLLTSL